MHADLQRLLADNLLADHTAQPIDRLRGIRVDLSRAEGDVSLVRRVTQGRLDIVGHEVDRRRSTHPDDRPDDDQSMGRVSGLLFDMPDILSDHTVGSGRPVNITEPGPIALALVEDLDGVASPSELAGIRAVDGLALADLFEALREFEVQLSDIRRQLHDRIDGIQDEIARRYRDGEASVDALLS